MQQWEIDSIPTRFEQHFVWSRTVQDQNTISLLTVNIPRVNDRVPDWRRTTSQLTWQNS